MEKRGKPSSSSSSTRKRAIGVEKKKKPMKKNKKHQQHRLLKKVIDYLKSDSYMYAPLLSSRPESKHIRLLTPPGKGIETELSSGYGENENQKKEKLMEKVVDYLKCDCYMYAPLLNLTTTQAQQSAVSSPTTKSPTPTHTHTAATYTEKVRYSPRKEASKTGVEGTRPPTPTKERESKIREDKANINSPDSVPPPSRTLVRKTVAYSGIVKRTLRHNCRVPGALQETETREVLVD